MAKARQYKINFETARYNKSEVKVENPEHKLQKACTRWFRLKFSDYRRLFIKPSDNYIKWTAECSRGAVAGAPDNIVLVPRGKYAYLCVEFKVDTQQSETQKEFEADANKYGGVYVVIRSFEEFTKTIETYMGYETNNL